MGVNKMNAIRKTSEKELVTKIALAKGIKDVKSLVSDLAPGKYVIDADLHLHGTVTRGEDFEKVLSNKVKWTLLAAILASKVNDATLDSVIDTYIQADQDGTLKDLEKQIKDRVQIRLDEVKGMQKAIVNGQVRSTIDMEYSDITVKAE